MKRWWLASLLLVSLGFNVGLVVSMWLGSATSSAGGIAERAGEGPTDVEPTPDGARRSRPETRSPRRATLEDLADRLELEGPERARFLALQRELQGALRRQLPALQRTRRALYREVSSPIPEPERLRALTERLARRQVEIEGRMVRTVIESRRLLDRRQDEIYLRFVAERFRIPLGALGPRDELRRRDHGESSAATDLPEPGEELE